MTYTVFASARHREDFRAGSSRCEAPRHRNLDGVPAPLADLVVIITEPENVVQLVCRPCAELMASLAGLPLDEMIAEADAELDRENR